MISASTPNHCLESRDHLEVTLRIGHLALVATTLAAVGLIAPISRSPESGGIRSSRPTARVAQIQIPLLRSVLYTGSLGVSGGHIVAGDETSSTVCRLAIVDPASLRVISNRNTPCTNPLVYGASAAPAESPVAPRSPFGFVRIATTSGFSAPIHVGPVVMRYDTVSPPEWTYGGGYLWLYDTALSNGPLSTRRTAEVLRISPATGRVLATVAVPSLPRVELAADEDGLWIARSQETTWSGTKPPPLLSLLEPGRRPRKL